MTDTTNIFNTEPTSSQAASDQTAPQSADNIFGDKLNAITTEDGKPKYETVDKALDALSNAQAHIPKLEQENADLRNHLSQMMEKVEKVSRLEEVVDRLNTAQSTPAPQEEQATSVDLSSQVNEILDVRSKEEKLASNELAVSKQMSAKFGDKVGNVLQSKANELGVDMDYLKDAARKSPKLFMSLFGESVKEPQVTTSSINTSAMPVTKPARQSASLMAGATSKDLMSEMAALKAEVKQKYGFE